MKWRYHHNGTRKGWVHLAYDNYGSDAAHELGRLLGLAESSVRIWIGRWDRKMDLQLHSREHVK